MKHISTKLQFTIQQVNEIEIYIPHIVEVAENLHEYLSDDDLITPFVRLGSFYEEQGLYPQAQPWLEKAKEIAEQRFGKEHRDVATSLNNLAELYRAQGRYDEAETLYLQALDMYKKMLGDEHPHTQIIQRSYQALLEQKKKLP